VVGVVDLDVAAAATLVRRTPEARPFDDLVRCLDECAADVVHVCTPLGTHTQIARLAIERRCHVLVEKPLAPSLTETEELLAAARSAGVAVSPVHQFPFQRGVGRLLARHADLGELVRVVYRTSSAGGADRSTTARRALLAEIVPHAASLFSRFAAGFDPRALALVVGQEDLAVTGLHGGTYLEAFVTLRGRPPCNELQLTGTRASALADLFHGYAVADRGSASGRAKAVRPFIHGARQLAAATTNAVDRLAHVELAYPGLRELVRSFYLAVGVGSPPPIPEAEIVAAAVLFERAAAACA
jgi:predicted dehydrogenase